MTHRQTDMRDTLAVCVYGMIRMPYPIGPPQTEYPIHMASRAPQRKAFNSSRAHTGCAPGSHSPVFGSEKAEARALCQASRVALHVPGESLGLRPSPRELQARGPARLQGGARRVAPLCRPRLPSSSPKLASPPGPGSPAAGPSPGFARHFARSVDALRLWLDRSLPQE